MPAPPRPGRAAWPPGGWSLRTKISVVLLLPVIVALTLAGARVRSELDQASRLSVVRDQLSVVQGVSDLADLVDQEMVAMASATAGATPTAEIDAVDAKAAAVQHDADFAGLPAGSGRALSTALGRLAGLRTANAGGDPVGATSGYRDIVYSLAELVPGLIAGAGDSALDATANTARSLVQLRTTLAVQEALLRSIKPDGADQAVLAAAAQAAAEESVIHGQVQRGLGTDAAARFNSATTSATDRRAVLQSSLATDRRAELSSLLLPIATESAGLGDLVTETFGSLSTSISSQTDTARSTALRDTALVIGALLAALAVALMMARSLVSPVRRLHQAALDAAHRRLPDTIERVRKGEVVSWDSVEPVGINTEEEIGQLAHAFDDMHRQAVRLAGEQAELRKQVSEMFMTLARRSQSMVELQLTVLEGLESDERDPQRLDELFRLDHLATRLRRNGENLQVLAGGSPARRDTGPVSMVELLRGATSEVKDYRRVSLVNVPNGAVRSQAAADVVHILAELLENATRFSPPEEKVYLTADRGSDGGLLVEVVDNGLGMTGEDLDAANQRLASGDIVSPETARRMGLFVVGRLAAIHGVTVRLRPTLTRAGRTGVTASVHLPGDLIIAEGAPARVPVTAGVNGSAYNGSAVNGSAVNGSAYSAPRPSVPVQPQVRTPIFDRVVSNWFTEHDPDAPAETAPTSKNWVTPADDARRAAETAVQSPASSVVSSAGLPTRTPGAQLAPGAALPRPEGKARVQPGDFRDPAAVRNNLSRHYNGMRAARQRTANEERS
ncbi:ATP-binding protein [Amycolatopsis acidiphila]|uniref:HAMP domain-containing sensor histidine kinase n=1 Tax=Amycolatopsis acidiphila TaxID=715473 RepID=UPI001E3BA062|nr:ATP-binding protein [Amycolatopsis acidiphila]UIJ61230.1 ATP-binding protein [Amycolatopsis acidiphila]